ncbi:MAG: hypothetical protein E6248_02850 [Clostridium sp.]|nr:hypothetical protein [Clostridium sp.]MDU5109358.1 hypothetical protein [Clostridium sp.]
MKTIILILLYAIPAIILYFMIKFAVKRTIKESMEDIESSMKNQ